MALNYKPPPAGDPYYKGKAPLDEPYGGMSSARSSSLAALSARSGKKNKGPTQELDELDLDLIISGKRFEKKFQGRKTK